MVVRVESEMGGKGGGGSGATRSFKGRGLDWGPGTDVGGS